MTRYAVLLRGVNGGGRRVAMPELCRTAENLGYADVSTYINSGNQLLSTQKSAGTLVRGMEAALDREFGFAVPVMVRTAARLRTVMETNPYPEGNPSQGTVAFLSGPAQVDAAERMADVAPTASGSPSPSVRSTSTSPAGWDAASSPPGRSDCSGPARPSATSVRWKGLPSLLDG